MSSLRNGGPVAQRPAGLSLSDRGSRYRHGMDNTTKANDLRKGHKLVHMDSGREVFRVTNDLNPDHPEWRSCTVFYGPNGKWRGGQYEVLTNELLESYADMPLALEYDEPES